MEVMEDSHAPETSVQPTRRDFLTAGGRFAMLGIFTAVTGYAIGSQPRRSAQRESTIAMDGEEWIDPTKLDERTRLIEKHLRVAHYAMGMNREIDMIAHSCGGRHARELRREHVRIVQSAAQSVALNILYPYPEVAAAGRAA